MRLLLVDKSAYARGSARVAARAGDDDELCLCAVTRLELLYSARSPRDYATLADRLARFRDLRIDAETFAIALSAQRELAPRGRHRLPVPDLLISACAHQHAADVLCRDRHFETLAEVLTFTPVEV